LERILAVGFASSIANNRSFLLVISWISSVAVCLMKLSKLGREWVHLVHLNVTLCLGSTAVHSACHTVAVYVRVLFADNL
jgi:hypothetical protein